MMSNLVSSVIFALFLMTAAGSAFGALPALPQSQPQESQPSGATQEAPEAKETPEAQSEQEEDASEADGDAEDDAEKGPKRQPGLLPLVPLAEVDLGARPTSPALFYEGSLIIVTEAGEALSLDSKTGDLLWKLGLPGSKLLPPCLFSEALLIVNGAGTLLLVDPATGTIQDELSTGISPALPPICQDSVVFLATAERVIIGYDVENRQEIWRAAIQEPPLAMAVGDDLLVVSDRAGALHALDSKMGLIRWQFQGRGTFPAPAVFDSKNERLFIGDTRGFFYSLSVGNGKVHYRWASGAAIPFSALVEEDRVFVATYANTLFCYRPRNGHELWRANLPGRPAASPERARRRVVVVTFDGQVAEYGSGGTRDAPLYTAPREILPLPTLMPGGLALPLRSGRLLLLQTQAPPPKTEPGEEGELEADTPPGETPPGETQPGETQPGVPITPQ